MAMASPPLAILLFKLLLKDSNIVITPPKSLATLLEKVLLEMIRQCM